MKPRIRTVLIGIVVVILGYAAYSRRFEIAAMVWHWRNGDFARVGNYEVPVPNYWLVTVEPSGLSLTDTRSRRNARVLSNINVIVIYSLSKPTPDLDFWKSYSEQWLKNNGIGNIEERSLNFEDEVVVCVGGYELDEVMHLPDAADVVSVDCSSSGRLHLMFVGQQADLQVFYSIIPKICKLEKTPR